MSSYSISFTRGCDIQAILHYVSSNQAKETTEGNNGITTQGGGLWQSLSNALGSQFKNRQYFWVDRTITGAGTPVRSSLHDAS